MEKNFNTCLFIIACIMSGTVYAAGHVDDKNLDENLLKAIESGNSNKVATLIKKGANPNVRNPFSLTTPIWNAAFAGHGKIVEILLKAGANPNILNMDGATALAAAAMGHARTARASGDSPELQKRYMYIMKILIDRGANPYLEGFEGQGSTALDLVHPSLRTFLQQETQKIKRKK